MTESLARFIVRDCRQEHAIQLLQFTQFDQFLFPIDQANQDM